MYRRGNEWLRIMLTVVVGGALLSRSDPKAETHGLSAGEEPFRPSIRMTVRTCMEDPAFTRPSPCGPGTRPINVHVILQLPGESPGLAFKRNTRTRNGIFDNWIVSQVSDSAQATVMVPPVLYPYGTEGGPVCPERSKWEAPVTKRSMDLGAIVYRRNFCNPRRPLSPEPLHGNRWRGYST